MNLRRTAVGLWLGTICVTWVWDWFSATGPLESGALNSLAGALGTFFGCFVVVLPVTIIAWLVKLRHQPGASWVLQGVLALIYVPFSRFILPRILGQ